MFTGKNQRKKLRVTQKEEREGRHEVRERDEWKRRDHRSKGNLRITLFNGICSDCVWWGKSTPCLSHSNHDDDHEVNDTGNKVWQSLKSKSRGNIEREETSDREIECMTKKDSANKADADNGKEEEGKKRREVSMKSYFSVCWRQRSLPFFSESPETLYLPSFLKERLFLPLGTSSQWREDRVSMSWPPPPQTVCRCCCRRSCWLQVWELYCKKKSTSVSVFSSLLLFSFVMTNKGMMRRYQKNLGKRSRRKRITDYAVSSFERQDSQQDSQHESFCPSSCSE